MAKLSLKTYQWILRAVVEILDIFPPRKIEKEEFSLRKGQFTPATEIPPEGTIWVHGASLGEVITLRPFLKLLAEKYGKERIFATATTMDGLRQLKKDSICGNASLLPIELPAFLVPFIDKIKPKVLLISETEIWPLMLATLKRKKIPYGIINGRINEKSVRLMRMLWPLFEIGVNGFSFAFPQEKHYLRRFKILGIPYEKQQTLGCFKYDIQAQNPNIKELRTSYGIPPHRNVICFGSTHDNEEEMILDALEPLWHDLRATVVIAPRHLKRVPEVEEILKKRNLDYSKVTKPSETARHVILVDTLGELTNFYAISSVAFVGGSLIKRGGHNLMEPAAFGVPILSGPNTFNFRYEMMALKKANAINVVNNAQDIQDTLQNWINNPEEFKQSGKRANDVLSEMSGAAIRTIDSLQKLGFLPDEQ